MQAKRMRADSAKQVAIDVLRAAGEPLHTKEVTKRVLNSGRCSGLKGKTPEATIAAMLAVGSMPCGPFKRVDKGTYALADDVADTTPAEQKKPKPAKSNAKNRTKTSGGKARVTPPARKSDAAGAEIAR